MYMILDMIDMGLQNGQSWTSPEHRQVAQNLAICNPNVKELDVLIQIVQVVLTVPTNLIKTITYDQIVKDYGLLECF